MLAEETYPSERLGFRTKLKDYALLVKLRLTLLVLVSAGSGYLMATSSIVALELVILLVAGFLVTGASNGFNQVIEREHDAKMKRTANRPIAAGRMSALEGLIFSSVLGISGVALLWIFLNPLSAILGFLALFMYVALYTPLKRITPLAVFVGAFPGAIPPMLGYVAHTGTFGLEPGLLFAVQFMWQFPHFWAIAWKIDDDYKKAGFIMLPTRERDRGSAYQIMLYSFFLIPVSLLPFAFGMTGVVSTVIVTVAGTIFFLMALRLLRSLEMKAATTLMFASFLYLPIVQFAYVFDQL